MALSDYGTTATNVYTELQSHEDAMKNSRSQRTTAEVGRQQVEEQTRTTRLANDSVQQAKDMGVENAELKERLAQAELNEVNLQTQKSIQDILLKDPNYVESQATTAMLDSKIALDANRAQEVFNDANLFASRAHLYQEGTEEHKNYIIEAARKIDLADDGEETPGLEDMPLADLVSFIGQAGMVATASVTHYQELEKQGNKARQEGIQARLTASQSNDAEIHNAVDSTGTVVGQMKTITTGAGQGQMLYSPTGQYGTWGAVPSGIARAADISQSVSDIIGTSNDPYSDTFNKKNDQRHRWGTVTEQVISANRLQDMSDEHLRTDALATVGRKVSALLSTVSGLSLGDNPSSEDTAYLAALQDRVNKVAEKVSITDQSRVNKESIYEFYTMQAIVNFASASSKDAGGRAFTPMLNNLLKNIHDDEWFKDPANTAAVMDAVGAEAHNRQQNVVRSMTQLGGDSFANTIKLLEQENTPPKQISEMFRNGTLPISEIHSLDPKYASSYNGTYYPKPVGGNTEAKQQETNERQARIDRARAALRSQGAEVKASEANKKAGIAANRNGSPTTPVGGIITQPQGLRG